MEEREQASQQKQVLQENKTKQNQNTGITAGRIGIIPEEFNQILQDIVLWKQQEDNQLLSDTEYQMQQHM